MKCPECKHSFRYSNVSLHSRVMTTWYAIFACPNCSVWLKPDKNYPFLINSGIILLFFSMIDLFFIDFEQYSVIFSWLSPLIAVTGLGFYLTGVFTIKLLVMDDLDL